MSPWTKRATAKRKPQTAKQIAARNYGRSLAAIKMTQAQATVLLTLGAITDTEYNLLISLTRKLYQRTTKLWENRVKNEYKTYKQLHGDSRLNLLCREGD